MKSICKLSPSRQTNHNYMNIGYLKKLSSKNKLFISVGMLLVLDIIFVYLLILPAIDNIKNSRNDVINLKIDLENKTIREKNLNTLNEKISKIEPQLEKINQIFISKNREIEFITTLESLESKYNIKQKLNIDLNNPEKGEEFNKIPISIDASGNFKNLMDYLANIESLSYYINIQNISLSKNSLDNSSSKTALLGQASQNQMELKISGYTYWK